MNWMGGLSLLLFWLPVFGPLIAGLVGGYKAGRAGRAVLAVFLPAVLMGLLAAGAAAYLTDFVLWSVVAGVGTVALMLLQIGPLLAGAIGGGLAAHLIERHGGGPRNDEGANR
jgi:predicted branched-subunit amino acid permease